MKYYNNNVLCYRYGITIVSVINDYSSSSATRAIRPANRVKYDAQSYVSLHVRTSPNEQLLIRIWVCIWVNFWLIFSPSKSFKSMWYAFYWKHILKCYSNCTTNTNRVLNNDIFMRNLKSIIIYGCYIQAVECSSIVTYRYWDVDERPKRAGKIYFKYPTLAAVSSWQMGIRKIDCFLLMLLFVVDKIPLPLSDTWIPSKYFHINNCIRNYNTGSHTANIRSSKSTPY